MKKLTFEEKIEIMNPCSEDWNEMIGNDHFRFCSHCAKNVNDISKLTRKEAMRLVRQSNGKLCIRYYVNPKTNRPVFLDTLHKITRRAPALTAGVMATSFALATAAYSQGEPRPVTQDAVQAIIKSDSDVASISGYVTDPKGAAIPYAVVTLINEKTFEYRAANASFEGFYEFKEIPPAEYTLKFEGGGFEAKEIKSVSINGELRRDAQLAIQGMNEVVEIEAEGGSDRNVTMGVVACTVTTVTQNALVRAVMNDDLDEVKARVMMHAKVNVRDKAHDGLSPLHAAVENGNIEIIQFLLDSGAKTNIRDFQKRTPLMMMDSDATAEIFDLLIRYGAKVQLVDGEKNTVLHHFVENADDKDIVRLLVSHGINVDAVNKSGETALMVAAENGNSADVKALLESGSDVSKLNRDGKTAWDLTDDAEVRSLLESYGAVARTIK
jgi:hypothetical protein